MKNKSSQGLLSFLRFMFWVVIAAIWISGFLWGYNFITSHCLILAGTTFLCWRRPSQTGQQARCVVINHFCLWPLLPHVFIGEMGPNTRMSSALIMLRFKITSSSLAKGSSISKGRKLNLVSLVAKEHRTSLHLKYQAWWAWQPSFLESIPWLHIQLDSALLQHRAKSRGPNHSALTCWLHVK
jgi:hypothetical protein